MRVQRVCEVDLAARPLPEAGCKQVIDHRLQTPIESCSDYRGTLVAGTGEFDKTAALHPLVAAAYHSYAQHRPLVLSPDMFWTLVLQGTSHHIHNNVKKLRSRFVAHDDPLDLEVRRDDFVKGTPENPWDEVFDAFAGRVREHIGDENHERFVAAFSTTGRMERGVQQVSLLEAMRGYFQYRLVTICGIPEVTLEGEPEDWRTLAEKTASLGRAYDLEWWTGRVVPRLEAIARNAAGDEDPELWRSFFKDDDEGCLSAGITGWIGDLFPYLMDGDDQFPRRENAGGRGIDLNRFPSGLSVVPFTWTYRQVHEFKMDFLAGFLGVTQEARTLALRPKLGWVVRQAPASRMSLGIEWRQEGERCWVESVLPGYEASRAGIAAGDLLVRLEEYGRDVIYCEVDRDGRRISCLASAP